MSQDVVYISEEGNAEEPNIVGSSTTKLKEMVIPMRNTQGEFGVDHIDGQIVSSWWFIYNNTTLLCSFTISHARRARQ